LARLVEILKQGGVNAPEFIYLSEQGVERLEI